MKRFYATLKGHVGLQIGSLAAVLLLICVIYRLTLNNTYTAVIPTWSGEEENREAEIRQDGDVPVEIRSREDRDHMIVLKLRPEKPGSASLTITGPEGEEGPVSTGVYQVGRFQTIYDRSTGGFTGDKIVLIAVTMFCFGVGSLMLYHFLKAKGTLLYSYTTIYEAGFSIFAFSAGIQMLTVTIRHLLNPAEYTMFSAYRAISAMSYRFMLLTTPFLLVLAFALGISNVELLRHEKKRIQNLLGILVGIGLIAGEVFVLLLYSRNFSGSEFQGRVHDTLQGVAATVFVYFECMLIGAIICGLRAARHIPEYDQDYVIILGCSFRKDGTLTPLLRGRVDRAVEFGRKQKETTGKDIIYVPSGGQGNDEIMPEGEAMSRYLRSIGIPEEQIFPETRSRNTYENMSLSGHQIGERTPGAKVIFSTTNYHVFRSGVWAGLAGLKAEGIGSRTKWWFWPNAFMRECAGLLVNRWKEGLVFLVLMIAFFAALTMLLG